MASNDRAHKLLKHLDWIKPILQLDFNYVKLAYERLTKTKPDHVLLNYYDIHFNEVAKQLPNQPSIVSWLVGVFQFEKPNVGKSVMVLDLLTTLTILSTGSITDKCKLLFVMYNINQTGLMEEGEHFNFIMRSSACMRKLKFIGTLDMTAEDAKYVALEARVKHENNQITFIPGLQLVDFTRWVQTNKECQTLFRFVKVLNRLVENMLTLADRTDSVLRIMEAKQKYLVNAPAVPPLDALPRCQPTSADLWLVFRSHTTASFVVPLYNLETTEVFVKCEKIVPMESALFEIPRSILRRNAELHRAKINPQLQCCGKYYTLTSHVRVPVDATQRLRHHVPFQRIDIPGLDPKSTYLITIYSETAQYRTVQVTTLEDPAVRRLQLQAEAVGRPDARLSASVEAMGVEGSVGSDAENPSLERDQGWDRPSANSGDSMGGSEAGHGEGPSEQRGHRSGNTVTILPATLSPQEAEAHCSARADRTAQASSRAIIFTGTVCPIDQVLSAGPSLAEEEERSVEFSTRVASALSAAASAQYAQRWAACLRVLLGMVQCGISSEHLRELVGSVEHASLVCYDGAGPWGSPESRRYLEELLGSGCLAVLQERLESVYRLYRMSLAPPAYTVQYGNVEVYFVRDASGADVTRSAITVRDLTDIVLAKIRSFEAEARCEQHVVVLLRDLGDLMGPDITAADGADSESAESVAVSTAASLAEAARSELLLKAPAKPNRPYAPTPKLRGKHEILHGEYSQGSSAIPAGTAADNSYLSSFLAVEGEQGASTEGAQREEGYDDALAAFLRVAFKWQVLGSRAGGDFNLDWSQKQLPSLHKLTLVSCNWDHGENFVVTLNANDAVGGNALESTVSPTGPCIVHENLLSTRTYVPPAPAPERVPSPSGDTLSRLPTAFGSAASLLSVASEEAKSRGGLSRPASRPSMAASSAADLLALAAEGSRPPSRAAAASRAPSRRELSIPEQPEVITPPPTPAFETTAAFAASRAAADRLMLRLQASLPSTASVQLKDATPLRSLSISTMGIETTMAFTSVNDGATAGSREASWWRNDADRRKNFPPEDVRICSGPHVVRCTDASAVVAVDTVGQGRVYCTLYEVPVHMTYDDVVAVVSSAQDRAKLRRVVSKSQYCTEYGDKHLVFQFEGLMPFCCYCAVVDPYPHSPVVALFRTLGLPSRTVDSILICPVSAEDYHSPSVRLNRLSLFASQPRSPTSMVFCLDYDAAVLRHYTGGEQRLKGDLNHLRKRANVQFADTTRQEDAALHSCLPFVVHHPSRPPSDDGSVFVSTDGHFCYIATQNEGSTALRKVIHAVRMLRYNPDVKLVMLMVNQPLIRYLRLRSDGQYACDGPFTHHKLLCCLLMMTLLDWKALDDGNDCKIITTAPVSQPKVVLIKYAEHVGDAVHPLARNDDLSLTLHPEPVVIVPLVEGGVLLEMPSFLEQSVEEPSMYQSIELQSLLRERRQQLGERSRESALGPDVLHLESIYESIDDFSIGDLQLQHQISVLFTAVSNESKLAEQSIFHHREPALSKADFVTVEHLILPVDHHTVEGEEVDEHITLPDGKCLMEDIVEYEVLHDFSAAETGVYIIDPRLELYRDTFKPEERVQPIVYRLDLMVELLKPSQSVGVDPSHPAVDASFVESLDSSALAFNMQHRVYLRPLLSEMDLVEVLLGPVVGTVTETTALVLFEFSTSLRQLTCVLQPLGAQDENDYVYRTIDAIRGCELVEVQFSDLLPGTYYEIYLPELFFGKLVGRFKTIQPFLAYAQIAVTSANTLVSQPIIPMIIEQLQRQQAPNLLEIRMLNDLILEDQRLGRNAPSSRYITYGGYDNMWARLGDHLAVPGVPTAAVFHLGDVTLLSSYWSALIHSMLQQVRRLEVPLRDASVMGQLYFKQVEQIVKDTFRTFWSTPVVQEVLSRTANLPLYSAQYLLPLSALEDHVEAERIAASEDDSAFVQLVRKIFESHLHMYLSRLYGWDVNNNTHTIQWRSNSLVVLGLDTVSGRRKIRKKGEGEGEGDAEDGEEGDTGGAEGVGGDASAGGKGSKEAAQTATTSSKTAVMSARTGSPTSKSTKERRKSEGKEKKQSASEAASRGEKAVKVDMKDPFSLGFIDRSQWKVIRALVQDRTVTHIVILTQQPILPPTLIPKEFRVPPSVAKGEVLDWQPTHDDLEVFLKFWFDWLAMFQRGEVAASRSLLLVSTCRMPYSTLIQDVRTGLKIQQLCVGEYDRGGALSDIPFKAKDLCMSGKLGSIRYVHQIEGQDYYLTQATGVEKNGRFIERGAENMASPTASGMEGGAPVRHLMKSAGFATLRLWFDSWNALGIWSQEPPDAGLIAQGSSAATLLVGPMLSAPTLQQEPATDTAPARTYFTVSLLLEVDRVTTITIQARSVFTDHELQFEMRDLQPKRPHVLEIGPLQLEDRYNFSLVKGLKPSPHNVFVIDTYIHENETNIMALNCARPMDDIAGSQILIEASRRCGVPFCGVTAVLHMNFLPDFERVINEFRYSNTLLDNLKDARRTGQLATPFRADLENMIEVFRDQYRTVLSKPSYAELLRHSFNLMMQNQYMGFSADSEPDPSSDLYMIACLIKLIIARLNQEYFDKWMSPHLNVFRAERPPDPNTPVPVAVTIVDPETGEVTVVPPEKPKVVMTWSDPSVPAVESVFAQWLQGCSPAGHQWKKWVSPNGKVSIEQIYSVTELNFSAIAEQLASAPIQSGTRIIVINQEPSHLDAADPLFLGESDIGVRFQDLLHAWKSKQQDREVCVVCPTTKYGTRKMDVKLTPVEPPPPPPAPAPPPDPLPDDYVPEPPPPEPEVWQPVFKELYVVDSAYRSNAFQRLHKQSAIDRELQESQAKSKRKNAAAAAKSKRAQRQREEEERLRKEEVAREIAELQASQIPDGYLLIGCVTTSIQTPDFTATVTNAPRVSVIGDFVGTEQEREEMQDDMVAGTPTAYDFIQLPEWFRKFSPSLETTFVRDEVLLLMRQNPETKRALNVIEDGEYLPQLVALYEQSRLSELSRPEDLREVDMKIPGVVPMFFRDLVQKMWDQVVPAEVKPHMFSLSDEFIMSYCFARALPDLAPLSSALEFAHVVQYTLVLSLALHSAHIMSKLPKYAYIIKSPDYPTQKVKAMEAKEKSVVDEKFRNVNMREAADKAWILADPKAAEERDRLAKEAAEEVAALRAAQEAISKKDPETAAMLKAAQELEELARDVEKTLAVVEVNYDSDLEAMDNDEVEDQKRQRAAEVLASIKQKDIEHTAMSIKMHASQRAERVAAQMTTKELAAAEEERAKQEAGEEFDVEGEGMERLDQLRSEWLVAAMEVAVEVVLEKEVYDCVKVASHQLLEECFEEARGKKLGVSEEGKLEHAKLQVSRLRTETAKSRRVYGKRMSFMT